tara:strand:- start:188 stop:436 length:249 start_codon:yes stop_codon:yes gene_type:complete
MGDEWEKLLLKYPDAKNDLDKFKDNIKRTHPPICKRHLETPSPYYCPHKEDNNSLLIIILSVLIVIVVLLSVNLGLKLKKGS